MGSIKDVPDEDSDPSATEAEEAGQKLTCSLSNAS